MVFFFGKHIGILENAAVFRANEVVFSESTVEF